MTMRAAPSAIVTVALVAAIVPFASVMATWQVIVALSGAGLER